jgi:putative solute:sodium symporter small subunit
MADEQSTDHTNSTAKSDYWRANIRLLLTLMAIWFAVSFGAGILLRDWLDQFSLGGYPLGFWFAQQGSIYVFIALIFFYNWRIHKIEQRYDLDDDDEGDS